MHFSRCISLPVSRRDNSCVSISDIGISLSADICKNQINIEINSSFTLYLILNAEWSQTN